MVTAVYEQITATTFLVDNVTAAPGSKEVQVVVSVQNNPGIVCMQMGVNFDENVMTLKQAENGEALNGNGFNFQKPKTLGSGNLFLWDATDASDKNGSVLILTFEVSESAAEGTYPINIFFEEGTLCDNDLNPISAAIRNGSIKVSK